MIRILLLVLLYLSSLSAFDFKKMSADYDVGFGVFGNVGVVNAKITQEGSTYKIKVVAKAKGLAAVLSNNREEIYESIGEIKNGNLLPRLFIKRKTRGAKTDIKRYFFNHKNKNVELRVTKVRGKKRTDTKKKLDYYAENDILTLFFNLKNILNDFKVKEPTVLYAVGANRKDGKIDIFSPKDKQLDMIVNLLGVNENIIVAIINQKIFSSARGELYMNLNDKGICTKAILKDVLLFGDIRGEIKRFKIR